jgi:hypothetical protein
MGIRPATLIVEPGFGHGPKPNQLRCRVGGQASAGKASGRLI